MNLRRVGPRVAASLLAVSLAGCLSGCSDAPSDGDEERPESTSVAQFCGALTDFQADLANADPADPATYAQSLKDAATRLDAVGVPDEMPAGARAGFDQQVAAIGALPAVPTAQDFAVVGQAAADPALETYLSTTCPTP